jgi:hypothetical protein
MHSIRSRFSTALLKLAPLAVLLISPLAGQAGTILTVPPGLTPGSQYLLVFVTSGTYAGNLSQATYNSDVTAAADTSAALEGLSTNWQLLGTTTGCAGISPETCLETSADASLPVYGLNGALIATDFANLVNGVWQHGILYDQAGDSISANVWTGINATTSSSQSTSAQLLGGADPYYGETGFQAPDGLSHATSPILDANNNPIKLSLYAFSGVLTVPAATTASAPEPGSMMLLGAGILGMAAFIRCKRLGGIL